MAQRPRPVIRIGTFEISYYGIAALFIIIAATTLRILLIAQNYPASNSDEGTVGLMALHIAYRGEWPVFFYGQSYMGPFEAYTGALLFHIFGPSLFSLRLGLVLFYALFMTSAYWLTSLLYTKGWAVASLILLTFGSGNMVARQLIALGGYTETLFFSTVIILVASRLALSWRPDCTRSQRRRRSLYYAGWGALVGLGFWNDALAIPFIIMAGVLLLRFCWSELRTRTTIAALGGGLFLSLLPVIIFNIAMPFRTLIDLWVASHANYSTALPVVLPFPLQNILGTVVVSLPVATGAYPLCSQSDLPPFGSGGQDVVRCLAYHGGWGVGYLALLVIAIVLAARAYRQHWRNGAGQPHDKGEGRPYGKSEGQPQDKWEEQPQDKGEGRPQGIALTMTRNGMEEERASDQSEGRPQGIALTMTRNGMVEERAIRYFARLALLCSGALALTLYTLSSSAAAETPAGSARYLIVLLVCLPAVFWVLWEGGWGVIMTIKNSMPHMRRGVIDHAPTQVWVRVGGVLRGGLLLFFGLTLVLGTIGMFTGLDSTRQTNGQRDDLVAHLYQLHATHIYSDYDTCNLLIFMTNEGIICSVLNPSLNPGVDRYLPYRTIVQNDPHAAYVFAEHSPQAATFAKTLATTNPKQYQQFNFDGYVVYQPT